MEFQDFQPSFQNVLALAPDILLVVAAVLSLAIDALCKKSAAKIGSTFASSALALAALISLFFPLVNGVFAKVNPSEIFSFAVVVSRAGTILALAGFLAVRVANVVRERQEFSAPIVNHLILISTASAMALLKASNFIAFFVLLETLTISLYALVGAYRKNTFSLEAGVKYLIAGGVSGGLMLFGIVLLYGGVSLFGNAADPLSYFSVVEFLSRNPQNLLGLVGAGMVLAGILFKFGVFPMQFWIPDTYQGAPLHSTFLLAALSKSVGFFLALIFVLFVFYPIFPTLFPILLTLTLISLVYANTTALGQQKVKRLLGLSGISHAGYMMLTILAIGHAMNSGRFDISTFALSSAVLVLYIVFYILSLYPIFIAMARVPANLGDEAFQEFEDFRGLAKRSPILSAALSAGLASLAGIPPTVGFVAKLGLLIVIFAAGLYVPAFVMLGCVVAAIYYYFSWIRAAFSTESVPENSEILPLTGTAKVSLIFFTALTILGCFAYLTLLNWF